MHQFLHPSIFNYHNYLALNKKQKKRMGSKTFLFIGLFLAILLMISSEVAARELAETSNSVKLDNENEVDVDGRGGYNGVGSDGYGKGKGCRYLCCKKKYYGCKKYCCSYAQYQAMEKVTETQP